jgi:ArsR family transcriptional regulator, arsenate/arsenite/antimonite-responsive transcriptional repressor
MAGDEMEPDTAVAALAALGHDLRLRVWRLLVPHGRAGLPAGTISAVLAVAPSSLSFHLQQMIQGGVLVQRRSSRQIIYAVNDELIDSLCDFLASAGGDMIRLPVSALASCQSGNILGK